MFKRPLAPEVELYGSSEGAVMTAQSDQKYKKKYTEFEIAEAAWKDARQLQTWKRGIDGIPVTMAIAATCGPQISRRVGQQFEQNTRIQPTELWKFLELMTCAVLMSARESLQMEMRTMRQHPAS